MQENAGDGIHHHPCRHHSNNIYVGFEVSYTSETLHDCPPRIPLGCNLKSKLFISLTCLVMSDLYCQSCVIDFLPSQSVNNIIALKAVQLKGYLLRIKFAAIRPNRKSHSGQKIPKDAES